MNTKNLYVVWFDVDDAYWVWSDSEIEALISIAKDTGRDIRGALVELWWTKEEIEAYIANRRTDEP